MICTYLHKLCHSLVYVLCTQQIFVPHLSLFYFFWNCWVCANDIIIYVIIISFKLRVLISSLQDVEDLLIIISKNIMTFLHISCFANYIIVIIKLILSIIIAGPMVTHKGRMVQLDWYLLLLQVLMYNLLYPWLTNENVRIISSWPESICLLLLS